jgi:hypothetical protein
MFCQVSLKVKQVMYWELLCKATAFTPSMHMKQLVIEE